jgi:hypothetical protein
MTRIFTLLFIAGMTAVSLAPLAAKADTSKCTARIKAQGFFITDIDSDWGRPYDKFSVIKANKEYDLWVNKNTCKIVHTQLDDDRRYYD